jgi:hypothetical protein
LTLFCFFLLFFFFFCLAYSLILKIQAVGAFETLVNFHQTTRCHVPEVSSLLSLRLSRDPKLVSILSHINQIHYHPTCFISCILILSFTLHVILRSGLFPTQFPTKVLCIHFSSWHVVAYLVEPLCYKSEGHVFVSRWGHCIFQLTSSFQPHYGPGIGSASNRNEYQESSWG